ncbi:MAG: HNH endonuclease [Bdellovibrionales bacterium]|nr:HNH endonuclease [Bdellovibrionales bacterium]
MNLKILAKEELMSQFKLHVANERKITAEVIKYIAEIDRRRLYLENSCTSLFDFLVKQMGYSPGAAMRRIDAARLIHELPEVLEKIETGALTLSQATQVQKASRELKKVKKSDLTTQDKRQLFKDIENTNQRESDRIIAATLDLPIPKVEKEILHKNNSVTLTITFTPEQMELLEKTQNMIAHTRASTTWADTIFYLAKKELDRRTRVRTPAPRQSAKTENPSTAVAAVKSALPRNRYIPQKIRKTLLHPNALCSHTDEDGRPCNSQRFLQIDHINNWSRGGSNTPDNLQVLCGVHNRLKYQRGR